MQLGDLLVRAGLVSEAQVTEALHAQAGGSGRLGDHLVAMGAIRREALDAFLHRIPSEPDNLAATGLDEVELLILLLKLIYAGRLETVRQYVEAIRLPYPLVLDLVRMAVDRRMLSALGARDHAGLAELSYTLTETGRQRAMDALEQCRYAGPAPVSIGDFNDRVNLQKLTNEAITYKRIQAALGDLTVEDSLIEQAGPALNSGRSMLMYGPPGNGKTSVALRLAGVFSDVVYVPYAILIEGQIIRMFDPGLHAPIRPTEIADDNSMSFVRKDTWDARWVPCRRPFVVAGGELTLEMLDLSYNPVANFYEAPLHMKALGGCFLIDDFGRQLVSPTHLLNRWIVPLESRVDYMKLHTGKTFSIPFEEMVIFSTNLDPEELMDPAFLRRLPYKIPVGAPSAKIYRRIFDNECRRQGLELDDAIFNRIVNKLVREKELELAAYQPRFIVDQVVSTCRFMGLAPHFEPRFVDYALDNLRVRRQSAAKHLPKTIEEIRSSAASSL